MIKNYCEGCYSYEEEYQDEHCDAIAFNTEGKCPCTECLIKVMCKMGCDAFERHYGVILKMINTGEVLR